MRKTIFKKAGATFLMGVSIIAISHMPKGIENTQHTKMSAEIANNPANAQLATRYGAGIFWGTVAGGVGAVAGTMLGTYIGGPWGGYIGGVLVGAGAAW